MNLSQIKKSIFVLFVVSMVSLTLIGCPDTITQQSSMQPASLDAPKLKGKAYDGVNIITWAPVKNATMYQVYRDNVWKETIFQGYMTGYGDLVVKDFADLEDGSIQNKVKYTYTVVAMGDQSGRGDSNTSNVTEFVLSGNDILGDSMASITLTAKVPEVFSQVEAAKNVKAMYMEDIVHGKVAGVYFEAPEYLAKQVDFAHSEEGSGVNVFDYLASGFHGVQANGYFTVSASTYAWTPVYGGKYKYIVKTSWPNPYFKSNEVLGEIDIPAQGENVPGLTATAVEGGIKVTFNDTVGANYTLYRAEDIEASSAWTFTKVADQADFAKTECGVGGIDYAFTDTGVVYGHYYAYVLTATKDNMALSFDPNDPAVDFVQYGTDLGWDPQFAAFNNDGTVELSWKVEEGVTYKVLKCTYDSSTAVAHKEEYLNNGAAINVGTPTLGVFVMTDTITRLDGTGYYKYTLTGTKNGIPCVHYDGLGQPEQSFDQIIGHNTTSPTFNITSVYGVDTTKATEGFNGLKDKVYVEITAANSINMSTVKFYRAEVAPDNISTYAGDSDIFTALTKNAEFISGYSEVTLTSKDDAKTYDTENSNTNYVYIDSSLTEDDLAMRAYSYVAVAGTQSAKGIYADSYTAITLPTIIGLNAKQDGSDENADDTYTIGWNAEYLETIPDSDPTHGQAANAAKINVLIAWSNATGAGSVTETWTPVTDYTVVDSTYYKQFSVGKDNKAYANLYVRVFFENANNTAPVESTNAMTFKFTNRAKVGHNNDLITAIGTEANMYTTNNSDTTDKVCYVMTQKRDGNLSQSNFTVYVTYLTGTGNVLYSEPKAVTLIKVTAKKDAGNNDVNVAYVTDDNPTFYFTKPSGVPEDTTYVLVHVVTSEGEIARQVVAKWW